MTALLVSGRFYAELAAGWTHFTERHDERCVCTHPEWSHMGFGEPACCWLGECPCLRYRRDVEVAA